VNKTKKVGHTADYRSTSYDRYLLHIKDTHQGTAKPEKDSSQNNK